MLSVRGQMPLAGREVELARVVGGLADGAPAAFVLAGSAGVGKTRLATEAAAAMEAGGFATAYALATRAASAIPFAPFAHLLPSGATTHDQLAGYLREASEAIARLGGSDRPLLLVVDDAHHLDAGSAALLHQLVRSAAASAIVTVRAPGPVPDPVTALWKDELAQRIDLAPLSEEQVDRVVAGVVGGQVARGTVRQLYEASRGNSLYLRELLAGALSSGALGEDHGVWTLRRPLAASERLLDLVASRLAELGPEAARAVELLAVGEPLALSLLEREVGGAAVEECERLGFVEVTLGGETATARLAHPVYGESLRQRLPRSRMRHLSALLASALTAGGRCREEDLLRVARWQLDAGGPADPGLLTRAARAAAQGFDFELAGRLAQSALDAGGGLEAGILLGEATFRSGRPAAAEAQLAALAARCANDTERARVANAHAYVLENLLGNPSRALAVIAGALESLEDVDARQILIARTALIQLCHGDPEEALDSAAPLLQSDSDLAASKAAWITSIALSLLGSGGEAAPIAARGLEAQRRAAAQHPQLPETQLIGAAMAHLSDGRLDAAERDATTGYGVCLAEGDREGQASFLTLLGLVLLDRGLTEQAAARFLEGCAINRALSDVAALRWCLAGVALARAASGEREGAEEAVAELDALSGARVLIFEFELVERARAWAVAVGGELSRARAMLRSAALAAEQLHHRVAAARLLHDVARLGDPGSAVERLMALAEGVKSELVERLAAHAGALARRDAAGVEAAGQGFEALGMLSLAAECAAAAAGLYRAEGLERHANAAARRAEALGAAGAGARSPARAALLRPGDVEPLTRRELEIAGLAAAGKASRDIAAALHVSTRTVDNHLQRAYTKLGISGRDQLASALDGAAAPRRTAEPS